MQHYHSVNASNMDSSSTNSDHTNGQPQRKWEGNCQGKNADNGYKETLGVGLGQNIVVHPGTHRWTLKNIKWLRHHEWEDMEPLLWYNHSLSSHYSPLSQFQLMWLHCRSWYSTSREWWAAFCWYNEQIFDETHPQMINWSWHIPCTVTDEGDRSNP